LEPGRHEFPANIVNYWQRRDNFKTLGAREYVRSIFLARLIQGIMLIDTSEKIIMVPKRFHSFIPFFLAVIMPVAALRAQWTQLNGPYGGVVLSLTSMGPDAKELDSTFIIQPTMV
jgi:hypothetical protein